MNRKMIAAGHICIDITPMFPRGVRCRELGDLLIPGKLINMDGADIHTGGSVANTGLALKKLGADVRLLGKVGSDAFGGMIASILEEYGTGGLIVDGESSTSYSVVLAVPGVDRIFLHDPGANNTFSNADIPEEALEDVGLFHIGYPPVMRKLYENGGAELAAILQRMKAHGIATSMDMTNVDPNSEAGKLDWEKLLANVLPHTDFFVPSFEELCFMLDRPRYEKLSQGGDMTEGLDLIEDVRPLAKRCLELGCRAVLIKCGVSGMYLMTAGYEKMREVGANLGLDPVIWSSRDTGHFCFKADQVLSGTGAGDTSIAAFLMAAASGKDPQWCVALAAAEGACAVTTYDALSGLKSLEELENRILSGWETIGG